jgi:hypothetical protein
MGRVVHAFGPEPRLNAALRRSFGKVRSKHELGISSKHTVIRKHVDIDFHLPVTTVKPGLDGCLLLQLLSVMRYTHHPRHVLNDTH